MKSTRKILAHSAHRLDSVIYSDSTLPTVYRYDYAGRVATVLDESAAWTTATAMPPTNNFTALAQKILTLNINSMKNIVCFVVYITTLICLSFAQNTDTNSMCEACKIVHIDSVGNYYVLYAKKTDNKYKILVKKKNNNCRNVVIGQFYNIVLSPPFIETISCYHNNITHLETGEVIIEKGWGRLYFGFNIEGLCYKDMTLAAVNDSLKREIEKLQNTSNSNQTQKGKKRKKTDKHGWSKLSKEEMIKRDTMTYYYETNPLIEE